MSSALGRYPRPVPDSAPHAAVVLLAAGEGRRVGSDTNKVLLPLAGLPVFAWSLRTIQALEYVDHVIVVIREQDRHVIERTLGEHFPGLEVTLVLGGSTRHGSEWHALQYIAKLIEDGELDVIAVHDAARPLARTDLFAKVIETAAQKGGAIPTHEQRALLPRDTSAAFAQGTRLVGVQTPQAFRAGPLLDAYRRADQDGFVGTDTASCLERYTRTEVRCVTSDASNLKITFAEDVAIAERFLEGRGPTC